jgi:subtilisin-like proprotein convertase family protein
MSEKCRINIATTSLICLILVFALQVSMATAAERQTLQRHTPVGLAPLSEVAEWKAPPINLQQLRLEDVANEGRTDIPYRVGLPMDTDITPANSGTWQDMPEGGQIWRLKVHTEGALWTVLGFGTFHIQSGGELRIYDMDQKALFGPYTAADIRSHGELWFPPIGADKLVVELTWPEELRNEDPRLRLTTVSHGYKTWAGIGVTDEMNDNDDETIDGRAFGDSGSCNIDTVCPEGDDWTDQSRGAVMVLVGGGGNCSGSLLNTTADDCRTMLLTAAHCGESGPSTTIGFNYTCATCGCTTDPGTITAQTLTGGVLRGNYATSDFTLIEMDNAPPEEYGAYFIGWSRDPNPALNTSVISYPRGDVRKIAFDFDPPVDGSRYGVHHWRVDDANPDPAHTGYELGTTEPASSGSPLMDQNHRVVGQLHGGAASCTSDTDDEYGKIDVSWIGGGTPATRLSDWLDPLATGAMFVDGIDHQDCLFQPAGTVNITRDIYSCSDVLTLKVRDDSLLSDTTVQVTLYSDTELTPETVILTEDDLGSGKFTGTILVTNDAPINADGKISVLHGDVITAEYTDADDGLGGTNLLRQDLADVDCAPPVITNVQSNDVTGQAAIITWDTDEPADSTVKYGQGSLDFQDFDESLVTAHLLKLTLLEECSPYIYSVSSSDVVSNGASDDNSGAYYTFETGKKSEPEFDSTDTPIAIVDNTTHLSTIAVPDDVEVQKVKVRMNITHTYDGDLDITLITPDGTRILLVQDNGGTDENYTDTVFDDEAATPIASGSAPYTGSFQPQSPLSVAIGSSSLGDWTLEVADDAGGDTGTLNSWTLILT